MQAKPTLHMQDLTMTWSVRLFTMRFWHGACMYDVFQATLMTEVLKCSEIQRGNQNGKASFAAQLEAQVAMSFWAVLILVFETCMSLDRRAASVWNLHTSSYIAKSAWTLLRGKCSQSH